MLRALSNLRLRTKFLCSLAVVTAVLTGTALLTVRHSAQVQVQKEVEDEARKALLTFKVMQRQHQGALRHKADLLATLARIRSEDASTIDEPGDDPWQSDDCNLLALADRNGKIVALRTTNPGFPAAKAEELLRESLRQHAASGWWYDGTRLYQVAIEVIPDGAGPKEARAGAVVVGHEIDAREVTHLRAISSSEVAFRYGRDVVATTLSPIEEQEFKAAVQNAVAKDSAGRGGDGRARAMAAGAQGQIEIGGKSFFASSVDLSSSETQAVSLTVLKSYSDAMAFLERLNHLLLGLGLAAVLAGGALVYLISDAFTRPLTTLAEGVRALEQGNFTYPLEVQARGGDEVAQVTRAFESMRGTLERNEANRRQLEDQLRQSQRMEAMGRLAGGVAHDFNNLLTVIKGHSGLLAERLNPADPLVKSSQQIGKAADRAASLTRQLLAFSRMQVLQPSVLDLNVLVADMNKLLARLIREDIKFLFRPGDALGRVKADSGQIEQVIMNLTVNACDAMPRGGELAIETRNVTVDQEFAKSRPPMTAGTYVLISVTDTGEGMDAATKARIFEPFFTTKEMGKGTGLGLATVYGVVKQSDGCIWVESEPGRGARFDVYLPRVNEAVESARSAEVIRVGPKARGKTVLIAEDEEGVRELASEFLRCAGYTVMAAKDGLAALAMVKSSNEPIHVLLTDVVMPNMRGPEFTKKVKALLPGIKVIYMSGYLDYEKGSGEFLEDGFFLQKPFSREILVRKVNEALGNTPSKPPVAQLVQDGN
jgi:signal transduction histidine kinase